MLEPSNAYLSIVQTSGTHTSVVHMGLIKIRGKTDITAVTVIYFII